MGKLPQLEIPVDPLGGLTLDQSSARVATLNPKRASKTLRGYGGFCAEYLVPERILG
jgi:hypothetical protein